MSDTQDFNDHPDSTTLNQPWKVWIDAEIAARQEAEASEELRQIQEARRVEYEEAMKDYPSRNKSPENKAG
ncbi:hypothetical protein F53441_12390 [Fusarium austroafricanum]|uniref:Uncharacterized protein n=1 Tax=Fusarium austroafricanum TaxID=2364996 RepID=A0A8H4JZK6_9HYPO|nr:hypothetical protein F53441_12390 [Fusarium austroafricanum]